jgi:hypothetical protein
VKKSRILVPLFLVLALVLTSVVYSGAIKALLAGIPAVGWAAAFGAVTASVISVAGVLASNYSSMTRLREQHLFDKTENDEQRAFDAAEGVRVRDHEAAQNAQDRKADFRREVYIEAIEEMLVTLSFIGGLFARPPATDGSDENALLGFLKASAKVWLVAETDAALHAREMTSRVAIAVMSALMRAAPLRQSLAAIRSIEERIAHTEAEVRRIETKIAEASEQLWPPAQQEAVRISWNIANEWLTSLRQIVARMHGERLPGILAYTRSTMDETKPVQEGLVLMVSQLRTEIHLAGNHEEFAAQLEIIEQRARDALNRVFGFGPDDEHRL